MMDTRLEPSAENIKAAIDHPGTTYFNVEPHDAHKVRNQLAVALATAPGMRSLQMHTSYNTKKRALRVVISDRQEADVEATQPTDGRDAD